MQLKQDEELGAVPEMAFDVSQAEYVFYENKMLLLKDVLKARRAESGADIKVAYHMTSDKPGAPDQWDLKQARFLLTPCFNVFVVMVGSTDHAAAFLPSLCFSQVPFMSER